MKLLAARPPLSVAFAVQHFETLRALGGVAGGEDVEVLAALAAAFGRSREQGAEVCPPIIHDFDSKEGCWVTTVIH